MSSPNRLIGCLLYRLLLNYIDRSQFTVMSRVAISCYLHVTLSASTRDYLYDCVWSVGNKRSDPRFFA